MSQPLTQGLVIPAKAGIQLIEKFPHSGSTSRFRPLRGLFVLQDSRFRGITNHLAACCLSEMASSFINDGAFGLSKFNDVYAYAAQVMRGFLGISMVKVS